MSMILKGLEHRILGWIVLLKYNLEMNLSEEM